jgi:hypothetical protein
VSNPTTMRMATLIMATLALFASGASLAVTLMHRDDAHTADAVLEDAVATLEQNVATLGDELKACITTTHPGDPDVPLGAC